MLLSKTAVAAAAKRKYCSVLAAAAAKRAKRERVEGGIQFADLVEFLRHGYMATFFFSFLEPRDFFAFGAVLTKLLGSDGREGGANAAFWRAFEYHARIITYRHFSVPLHWIFAARDAHCLGPQGHLCISPYQAHEAWPSVLRGRKFRQVMQAVRKLTVYQPLHVVVRGELDVHIFCLLLKACPNLEALVLDRCVVGRKEGGGRVSEYYLPSLPRLREVTLIDSPVNSGFYDALGRVPCAVERSLSVSMYGASFPDDGQMFSEDLAIQSFDLRGVDRGDVVDMLTKIFRGPKKFKHVDFCLITGKLSHRSADAALSMDDFVPL